MHTQILPKNSMTQRVYFHAPNVFSIPIPLGIRNEILYKYIFYSFTCSYLGSEGYDLKYLG